MQRYIRILFIVSLTSLIVACSNKPYPVSSPYYIIPTGTKIIVNKTLIIPANRARVTLQAGQVVAGQVDQYEAHCWFLSWEIHATEQKIEPDVFTVVSSEFYDEYVNRKSSPQFVSNGGIAGSGGGLTAVERITTLKIHSDRQINIREFSCNYWGDPYDSNHLTVAEIQAAVGSLVSIKVGNSP